MAKVLLFISVFLLSLLPALALDAFITDDAGILTPDDQARILPILQQLYDQNVAQFAIVTVNSLEGKDAQSYALELAQGKLGDMEKNNGLLLLISVEDREYRFEVGRGLEPMLPDSLTGRIGRTYLVPYFQNGEYGEGVYQSVLAVSQVLGGGELPEEQYPGIPKWVIIMVIVIVILSILSSFNRRRSNDYFVAGMLASQMFRRGGSGGFGGRGFGGFGGGGFGGGGAGGKW